MSAGPDAAAARLQPVGEAFNCSLRESVQHHKVRVLSQSFRLYDLVHSNDTKSFRISTSIQIFPLKASLTQIALHLGPYCLLPNEQSSSHGHVQVNGIDAKYKREKLVFDLKDQPNLKNLPALKQASTEALSKFKGDLLIDIPAEVLDGKRRKILVVSVDCLVLNPVQGVYFAPAGKSGDGAHIYTYRSSIFSSTRDWLPCLDQPDQLCLWKLEFEVPYRLSAIASGELVEMEGLSDESTRTFSYCLNVPTAPVNIGFVIGDFEVMAQPEMPDVCSYTLPGLMPLAKHTLQTLPRIFNFLEETLTCRFPYNSYKMVFVDQPPEEQVSFAGLTLFSLNLLYHKKILDVVQSTRQVLALGITSQFFGCFVNARSLSDQWVVKALAQHVTAMYVEKTFGCAEYQYQMNKLLENVCEYERSFGPIVLQPRQPSQEDHLYFNPDYPESCSSHYAEARCKKGQFVMRCLQGKLGKEHFVKVLNRILVVATQFSQHVEKPAEWYHMVVSGVSFFRTVLSVSGRELGAFLDLFVFHGGHAHFEVNFQHNRKRNTIELELRQEARANRGIIDYVGPLTITVQELDGCFTHTVQVDANTSKHDLQCHSKGRRQKRKKVPLSTGEELDIDLGALDADSPVMWIRVDPQMELPRTLTVIQPQNQWEYMLRYERCIIAQFAAIEALQHFPLQNTHNVLNEAIHNEKFFYRVRSRAAFCLTEISNRLPEGLITGKPPLIDFFEKQFGSASAAHIPALHNFVATSTNLQQYFLMSSIPLAIGRMRRGQKCCPHEVVRFLLGLLQFNDNSINRYSDDHYRAALIGGLTATLSAAEKSLAEAGTPDALAAEVDEVLREVTRAMNMDQIAPTYHKVISQACLKCILMLQRYQHIPADPEIFWPFASNKSVFSMVRKTALICLTSMTLRTHNLQLLDTVDRLFDLMLADPSPFIRHTLAQLVLTKPPFTFSSDIVNSQSFVANTKKMAERLWSLITDTQLEPKLRSQLVDIFYMMYSSQTPLVLRPEEEIRRIEREQRQRAEFKGGAQRL